MGQRELSITTPTWDQRADAADQMEPFHTKNVHFFSKFHFSQNFKNCRKNINGKGLHMEVERMESYDTGALNFQKKLQILPISEKKMEYFGRIG